MLLAVVASPLMRAQRYEFGADIGYGFYRNGTIYSPEGSVQAGIRNRFAAGILFGDDFSPYVSAEFNYLYHDGHPFLSGQGADTDIQGQSQTWTLGLLFHFRPRGSRFRPFVSGAVGAKDYVIAGPEPYPQPIPQIATLVAEDQWKFVVAPGGGIEYRLRKHILLRAEFRDYITTFPRRQLRPAPHDTARGLFEQFTPLFAVSYAF
jgi:Outer membrane protein beta-barrel domain